jgi:hypothetical protein
VPSTESACAVRPQHLEVHIERRINRAASWRRSIRLCDAAVWNACRAYAPGATEAVLLLQVTFYFRTKLPHPHAARTHRAVQHTRSRTYAHHRKPSSCALARTRCCRGWTHGPAASAQPSSSWRWLRSSTSECASFHPIRRPGSFAPSQPHTSAPRLRPVPLRPSRRSRPPRRTCR